MLYFWSEYVSVTAIMCVCVCVNGKKRDESKIPRTFPSFKTNLTSAPYINEPYIL